MPLFGRSKTPKEIISSLRENLLILVGSPTQQNPRSEKEKLRAQTDISRNLNSLKELISNSLVSSSSLPFIHSKVESTADINLDTNHVSPGGALSASGANLTSTSGLASSGNLSSSGSLQRTNEVLIEVGAELQQNDLLFLLLTSMDRIEFEASKYVGDLFCMLLHRQVGDSRKPTIAYLCHAHNQRILALFLTGYEKPEIAIQYGMMLREVSRHEELVRILLQLPEFYNLFNYVQGTAFDVSSDAFQSLRDLLTRHKSLVSKFLEANYENFFRHYHLMINSNNYATKRQALKLLSELLLERSNFVIMKRYIDDVENLKLIMNLLKVQEKQIAFEAFHCFKVFVANPSKERQIHLILFVNRDKLVDFLCHFLPDRNEDAQFKDEKEYLVRTIRDMKPFVAAAVVSVSADPPECEGAGVSAGQKPSSTT